MSDELLYPYLKSSSSCLVHLIWFSIFIFVVREWFLFLIVIIVSPHPSISRSISSSTFFLLFPWAAISFCRKLVSSSWFNSIKEALAAINSEIIVVVSFFKVLFSKLTAWAIKFIWKKLFLTRGSLA